jgi:hypothetical protein
MNNVITRRSHKKLLKDLYLHRVLESFEPSIKNGRKIRTTEVGEPTQSFPVILVMENSPYPYGGELVTPQMGAWNLGVMRYLDIKYSQLTPALPQPQEQIISFYTTLV